MKSLEIREVIIKMISFNKINSSLWSTISNFVGNKKDNDNFHNFVKSRKGEDEIRQLIHESQASKTKCQNPNVIRALVMEKLILPKMKANQGKKNIRQ